MGCSMSQPLSMIPAEPGSRVACAGPKGWLIYTIIGWAVTEEISVDDDDDLVEVAPGWRHTHVESVILEPSVGATVGSPPHAWFWLNPSDEDPSPAECEEAWAEITERQRQTHEQREERRRAEADRVAKAAQFRADARARRGVASSPTDDTAVAQPALTRDDVRPPLGRGAAQDPAA